MIFYLTYNDAPSGIYSSQVVDVVKFVKAEFKVNVRLVAFISLRGFFENKKNIKAELQDALVLPMFPGVRRWRKNVFLLKILCFLWKPDKLIARSVLATQLALTCKKNTRKIIYDGRGAIAAEWKEYGVISDTQMLSEIQKLERDAILNSDFRIAVSQQLLDYWQSEYTYNGHDHVVIPCTLNAVFEKTDLNQHAIVERRKSLGLHPLDMVFVYSGSTAGWQSFELLHGFIVPLLRLSLQNKLLFLADTDPYISKLKEEFPTQILSKKVKPNEVAGYLMAGDYGLLIREQSLTNLVASPLKFSEYLACGLKVIISEKLGDYSGFVKKHACGLVWNGSNSEMLQPVPLEVKKAIRSLALKNFTKKDFINDYAKILKL